LRQTKSDSRQALLIDPTSGVPGIVFSFRHLGIVSIRALWKAECRQGRKGSEHHVFLCVCAREKNCVLRFVGNQASGAFETRAYLALHVLDFLPSDLPPKLLRP
jgi:hypothetical protein